MANLDERKYEMGAEGSGARAKQEDNSYKENDKISLFPISIWNADDYGIYP